VAVVCAPAAMARFNVNNNISFFMKFPFFG
jgi:hypothetical protein